MPNKNAPVPVAVQNLRRLWNAKKHELEINQSDAAIALGWTQGAFSQYLNNLTDLNPAAVIKLANFFEVDPLEIDPLLYEHTRQRLIPVKGSTERVKLIFPSEKSVAIKPDNRITATLDKRTWDFPPGCVFICEPVYRTEGPFMYKDTHGEWCIAETRPKKENVTECYRLHSLYFEF